MRKPSSSWEHCLKRGTAEDMGLCGPHSPLAVSDCDRLKNLGFRFSACIAVFVTFGCIFKTSFAT